MVFVDVLGYVVEIVIEGGVILGYCLMGSEVIVNIFVIIVIIVSIYVNMGLFIKKWVILFKFFVCYCELCDDGCYFDGLIFVLGFIFWYLVIIIFLFLFILFRVIYWFW